MNGLKRNWFDQFARTSESENEKKSIINHNQSGRRVFPYSALPQLQYDVTGTAINKEIVWAQIISTVPLCRNSIWTFPHYATVPLLQLGYCTLPYSHPTVPLFKNGMWSSSTAACTTGAANTFEKGGLRWQPSPRSSFSANRKCIKVSNEFTAVMKS